MIAGQSTFGYLLGVNALTALFSALGRMIVNNQRASLSHPTETFSVTSYKKLLILSPFQVINSL